MVTKFHLNCSCQKRHNKTQKLIWKPKSITSPGLHQRPKSYWIGIFFKTGKKATRLPALVTHSFITPIHLLTCSSTVYSDSVLVKNTWTLTFSTKAANQLKAHWNYFVLSDQHHKSAASNFTWVKSYMRGRRNWRSVKKIQLWKRKTIQRNYDMYLKL